MSDQTAVHKINEFLRAARDHDRPDVEVFTLKAEAFEAMAAEHRDDGDMIRAVECEETAAEARSHLATLSR